MSAPAVDFVVDRKDLRQCRLEPAPPPAAVSLAAGEVLVAVDRFAFTANNVSYGVVGEMLSYWSFFPAAEGHGRIPVWGFGDVLRSTHPDVEEGERLYGYFPMSSYVVLRVGEATPEVIVDASPHRRPLPPVYNQYHRVARDPLYARETEDLQMLFRPLFLTAFLLDDFLAEAGLFGARAIVLTSASSKTAFGLASLLSGNRRAPGGVIGLTSARNAAFVERLGCYDRVVRYDEIASLPSDVPTVSVDMAGDGRVLATLHRHLGDALRYSCLVGLTHWEQQADPAGLPGPTPTFFFAPDQAGKRVRDWGPAGFAARTARAWDGFLAASKGWIRVSHGRGREAVERVYRDTLEGRTDPAVGHVLTLR